MRTHLLRATVLSFSVLALAHLSLVPRSGHAGSDYDAGLAVGLNEGRQQGATAATNEAKSTQPAPVEEDSGDDGGGGC